jgi:hypothetical protein
MLGGLSEYRKSVMAFVKLKHPELHKFWLDGCEDFWGQSSLQDHADFVYLLCFLEELHLVNRKSVDFFCNELIKLPLAGTNSSAKSLLPHLTAYLLGALNLLEASGFECRETTLRSIKFELRLLINESDYLPLWPKMWSHHSWRVSHWIGGIPAIMLTVARHSPTSPFSEDVVLKVLESIDKNLIFSKSGLLRAYKSELIQHVFRLLYRLRHNPAHGDIGGLVHIHWVNYATGRNYINPKMLIDVCIEHLSCDGFLESYPYCLDFDYIQLVRTLIPQIADYRVTEINKVFESYRTNLEKFLENIPTEGYTIHKLVGAMATYDEIKLIYREKSTDIINSAYWL